MKSLTATETIRVEPNARFMARTEYPPQLLARGLAGWVLTEFTVTETGAVKNAVVLASKPSGLDVLVAHRFVP